MNDKEYRDICAMFAMQVLLKEDLDCDVDKQKGRKWVAEQAYKTADIMLNERNKRGTN